MNADAAATIACVGCGAMVPDVDGPTRRADGHGSSLPDPEGRRRSSTLPGPIRTNAAKRVRRWVDAAWGAWSPAHELVRTRARSVLSYKAARTAGRSVTGVLRGDDHVRTEAVEALEGHPADPFADRR